MGREREQIHLSLLKVFAHQPAAPVWTGRRLIVLIFGECRAVIKGRV